MSVMNRLSTLNLTGIDLTRLEQVVTELEALSANESIGCNGCYACISGGSRPCPLNGAVTLECPYKDKDAAKVLGAIWNVSIRKWVVPLSLWDQLTKFNRWLPVSMPVSRPVTRPVTRPVSRPVSRAVSRSAKQANEEETG